MQSLETFNPPLLEILHSPLSPSFHDEEISPGTYFDPISKEGRHHFHGRNSLGGVISLLNDRNIQREGSLRSPFFPCLHTLPSSHVSFSPISSPSPSGMDPKCDPSQKTSSRTLPPLTFPSRAPSFSSFSSSSPSPSFSSSPSSSPPTYYPSPSSPKSSNSSYSSLQTIACIGNLVELLEPPVYPLLPSSQPSQSQSQYPHPRSYPVTPSWYPSSPPTIPSSSSESGSLRLGSTYFVPRSSGSSKFSKDSSSSSSFLSPPPTVSLPPSTSPTPSPPFPNYLKALPLSYSSRKRKSDTMDRHLFESQNKGRSLDSLSYSLDSQKIQAQPSSHSNHKIGRESSVPSSSSLPFNSHSNSRGSNPCQVQGCLKTFSTKSHLQRHSRMHSGERPFPCPFPNCNSRFSRHDNCIQHHRTHFKST